MDIKINKWISVSLSIVIIIVYLFGLPLIYMLNHPYSDQYSTPFFSLIVESLSLTFQHLTGLIIGIWMFYNAKKMNQDKWTWLLVSLVYGPYSLILIAIILISQKNNFHLNPYKPIQNFLVLSIFIIIINLFAFRLSSYYLVCTNGLTQIIH